MNHPISTCAIRLTLVLLATLNPRLSTVFAQGSLTPPGAPAPTMKTLDQVEPRTPITSLPFTIVSPGSYYVAGDLAGKAGQHGIIIDAPDVTLDLKGFTLRGVANSLNGIQVTSNGVNRLIQNGTIRGWGGSGIEAWPPICNLVDLRSLNNGGHGFNVGENSRVRNCIARSNTVDGIHAGAGSSIHDCVVEANAGNGVRVLAGSAQGVVAPIDLRGVRSLNNGLHGFALAPASFVRDCFAAFNGGDGINTSEGSALRDCVVHGNTGNGVQVVGTGLPQGVVAPIDVRDLRSVGNGAVGILIGLDQGSVRDCVVAGNKSDGLRVPSHFTIGGNELRGNGLGPNGGNGLSLTGSNNIVFGNRALQNAGKNFDIPAGNDAAPLGSAATSTSPFGNLQPAP